LIDNEPGVLSLIETVLSREGYRVLAVADAHEAILLSNDPQSRPDLLLTDVSLPQIGGAELAQLVCRNSPTTRVLFMSGHNGAAIAEWGVPADAAVLQKPFLPSELVRQVEIALIGRPFASGSGFASSGAC
jgi:two-component system cell cycle sensor histidine kinase/response regulator CckA